MTMRDLTTEVAKALAELASRRQTISYGALARQLSIPGPGSIEKLTNALEALMTEDVATGRPLRAALCYGRLSGDLPTLGFFDKAATLGRYEGCNAEIFVRTQRTKLFEEANPSHR